MKLIPIVVSLLGYCGRGEGCWYRHGAPAEDTPQARDSSAQKSPGKTEEEEDHTEATCGICFEKPLNFGLLSEHATVTLTQHILTLPAIYRRLLSSILSYRASQSRVP